MTGLTVYIGFDSSNYGQQLAHDVCKQSIQRWNPTVEIRTLYKKDLVKEGLFYREDNTGATEFTYTRFLVPYLNGYQGYALFCDSDFLWSCDVAEVLQYIDPSKAVACVQHQYAQCPSNQKMDGRAQEWYPRKNWTSLMLFNCAHPSCKNLSLEAVNIQSPAWLHRILWADDTELSEIPHDYNYLVDYYNDREHPKVLHYTDGGPWHPGYQNVQYGDLWLNYLTPQQKDLLDTELLFYSLSSGKLFLIAGPCVIESQDHCLKMATAIKSICQELGITYIFKASFDKANRTSIDSYRGPGLLEGVKILAEVKRQVGVPILTDIHLPEQCEPVGKVCDILQVPAFLCRQTDLLIAAAETGRIVNVKKGQFCNQVTMKHAFDKICSTGNKQIILTDRGTMFGYGDLIVDFRNHVLMRENKGALIVQDCTHALQQPNQADYTLGLRELIPTIARAAVAVGVDGLFMEVHDDPEKALSDASTQYPLRKLRELLVQLLNIHKAKSII